MISNMKESGGTAIQADDFTESESGLEPCST